MFKLELFLPEDYPMTAPKVRFTSQLSSLFNHHNNLKGPVHNTDLPPKHRQAWQNLPRHPEGKMESCSSD